MENRNHNFSAYRRKDYFTPRSSQEAFGGWVEIYVEEEEEAWFEKWMNRLIFLGGCIVWGLVGALFLAVVMYYGSK